MNEDWVIKFWKLNLSIYTLCINLSLSYFFFNFKFDGKYFFCIEWKVEFLLKLYIKKNIDLEKIDAKWIK